MRAVLALAALMVVSCQSKRVPTQADVVWLHQATLPTVTAQVVPPFQLGAVDAFSQMGIVHYIDTAIKDKRPVIDVVIDSPGGSATAAFTIMRAILGAGRPVHCRVTGLAASAAFVILQACTVRSAADSALFMMHEASASGEMSGGVRTYQNVTNYLGVINRTMVRHCARRIGIKDSELAARIEGGREWWLTADEALAAHVIDGIR